MFVYKIILGLFAYVFVWVIACSVIWHKRGKDWGDGLNFGGWCGSLSGGCLLCIAALIYLALFEKA